MMVERRPESENVYLKIGSIQCLSVWRGRESNANRREYHVQVEVRQRHECHNHWVLSLCLFTQQVEKQLHSARILSYNRSGSAAGCLSALLKLFVESHKLT